MTKTLYGYLGRELLKVTCLALVAFTLIMTVFAILKPLHNEGLDARQATSLIGCTVPMMMSLTLPVAALFAATIVYGRFSQDNEYMACRASGVSTLGILKPAVTLGVAVTILSLILSSFLTPKMAMMAETTVKANVRNIAYHRLRRKNYVDWGNLLIHADAVNQENDKIQGVVVAYTRDPDDIRLVAASTATVGFTEDSGNTWVTFDLSNPAVASTGNASIFEDKSHPPITRQLPSLAREDPSWYTWGKLASTLKNPVENRQVKVVYEEIQQALCYDMLAREISSAVQSGGSYRKLSSGDHTYVIRAGAAEIAAKATVELKSADRDGGVQKVEVQVFRNGEPYQLVTADSGRIETTWSPISESSFVTVKLTDGVKVLSLQDVQAGSQQRDDWTVGQLPIPKHLTDKSKAIPLLDIVMRAGELTEDEGIMTKIRELKDQKIQQLINRIKAEMHMRAAYGLSCFLMVSMGAAFGLLLRGGQIVSAFAISMVPAALVIVMMIMGKQMVRNPEVSASAGLAAIWVGVILLLGADVVIYTALSRK